MVVLLACSLQTWGLQRRVFHHQAHQCFSVPKPTPAFGALNSIFFLSENFVSIFLLHNLSPLDSSPLPIKVCRSGFFGIFLCSCFRHQLSPSLLPSSASGEQPGHQCLHAWTLPDSQVFDMISSPPTLPATLPAPAQLAGTSPGCLQAPCEQQLLSICIS